MLGLVPSMRGTLYVTSWATGKERPSTVCPSRALGKPGPSTARMRFWQRRRLLSSKLRVRARVRVLGLRAPLRVRVRARAGARVRGLAEAQVVELEVDLEEVVDHVERAPPGEA